MTCVIDISLLQFGQLSIVGTTEHARLVLMTLPFARQNVEANKRLTLDWVPVSLKSKSLNWLGRFATAARSPSLLCAYYPQESSKKETGYDASRMPCHAAEHRGPVSTARPTLSTRFPLAYGAFCAAYDSCMAGYFFTRRAHWNAAWTGAYSRTERAKVALPPETYAGRMP
jgi:hypothetical protein